MTFNLPSFSFIVSGFHALPKLAPTQGSQRFFSCAFSSRNFMFSVIAFRPMIHFKLLFIYGVRQGCRFILFSPHEVIQLFQQHLLKNYPIPIVFLWHFWQKSTFYVWVYWAFCSTILIYMSILISGPHCLDYCSFIINL